jgi:ribose transport system permease protein
VTARVMGQAGVRRAGMTTVLRLSYTSVAAGLFVVMIIVNVVVNPAAFQAGNILGTVGLAGPTILAAVAITPAILVGGGGIDLSVGPLMSLVGAVVVVVGIGNLGITNPGVLIPMALGVGLVSGLINGLLVAVVRLQPIVATLGTYLACIGLTLVLAPQPTGSVPGWLASMASTGSVPLLVITLALWGLFTRTPLYKQLMATGDDDRAAFAAGVPVTRVRISAYVMTGLLGSVAGLSLTALLGSVDPNAGTPFTLLAVAAVALGGVSLAGGRGGMTGAVIGGINIFLIQNLLTYFNKSAFVEQLVYGIVLVLAICGNALTARWGGKKA